MTRRFILISLFLLAGLVLISCSGTPEIVATPAQLDFGDIPASVPTTGTLALRNHGNGPLRIENLRTSCGCTAVEVTDASVAPGAETVLTITFDPMAHPGLYGPLLRMVYIETNDPGKPELEIPVTVNVLSPEEASQ